MSAKTIKLDDEFAPVLQDMAEHQTKKRDHVRYYNNSVYYQRTALDPVERDPIRANLLRSFTDKNINYTSVFPSFKVPHNRADPESRAKCALVERVLYGTHAANGGEAKHKQLAFDASVMSEAFVGTEFDIKARRVKITRYDPRYCYYQFADDNSSDMLAFWVAFPMTAEAIEKRWGKRPVATGLDLGNIDSSLIPESPTASASVGGRDWYYVCYRWDGETKTVWAGDVLLEDTHDHLLPGFPIDRVAPLISGDVTRYGQFFQEPLLHLQAEYNATLEQARNVVKKLANPLLWVKGLYADQLDELKQVQKEVGGALALKQNADIGLLELKENTIHSQHLSLIRSIMQDISGYSDASFGNPVGANTSAEAVNMYFQPTTQAARSQWISWTAFYESVNDKIIKLYQEFGLPGEEFKLHGNFPRSTVTVDGDDVARKTMRSTEYSVTFTPEMIEGDHTCKVIPPDATPKDDQANARMWLELARDGAVPKVVGYEKAGAEDPEDWLDLHAAEMQDPRLQPPPQQLDEATAADKLASAASKLQPPGV